MMNKKKKIITAFSILITIASIVLYEVATNYYEIKKQNELKQIELVQELQKQQMIDSLKYEGVYYISIDSKEYIGDYISQDETIVKIENNILIPIKVGTAIIYSETNKNKYEVSVSDLYKNARIDNNKEYLPCGEYSIQEGIYLDNVLDGKIQYAGYKTRAGVVAAARFLALEFTYRIPYFYENGRLNGSTGHPYADGEGRFYHKGLYLTEDKYSLLDPNGIKSGPQTWGCVMFSGAGGDIPNGLDCSGFVSWCLYQAGFDPGDVGGGDARLDGAYNLPDLGVGDGGAIYTNNVEPNTIQAGDIIAWEGTIAIVIGVDDNNIYVAHAYWDNDLEVVTTPKENLAKSEWHYITLMDNYYNTEGNGQGNYTNMWQ